MSKPSEQKPDDNPLDCLLLRHEAMRARVEALERIVYADKQEPPEAAPPAEPQIEPCAECGWSAELCKPTGGYVICANRECRAGGPYHDPDGRKWNRMQRMMRFCRAAAEGRLTVFGREMACEFDDVFAETWSGYVCRLARFIVGGGGLN